MVDDDLVSTTVHGSVGAKVCNAALALEGGGFLAFTVQTAIISGLLAAHRLGSKKQVDLIGLLRRFGTISSVSGGSWFACELAFSPIFADIVQRMGTNPSAAGAIFDKEWVEAWLSIGNRLNPLVELVALAVDTLSGKQGLAQNIREIAHFVDTGLNWRNFCATLLWVTAGIEADRQLGSEVLDWAKGKVWVIGSSLVLPTGQNGAEKVTVFTSGPASAAAYAVKSFTGGAVGKQQLFVPARSSIVLGAGLASDAPFPYVAPAAVPPATTIGFTGVVLPAEQSCCASGCNSWLGGPSQVESQSGGGDLALGTFDDLQQGAGSFSLIDVIGASSAFLGRLHIVEADKPTDAMTRIAGLLGADMAMWVCPGVGHGQGFARARELVDELYSVGRVTRDLFDGLARSSVVSVIDGGFTDCTGIAHAVATGASEIVALLNHTLSDVPTYMLELFGDMSDSASESIEKPNRIFAEDVKDVRARCDCSAAFPRLKLRSGTQKLLSIAIGNLPSRTVRNDLFGIDAGRDVILRVISVTATLNVGELEDFHDYGVLLQEIITALTSEDNEVVVQRELLSWFAGPMH